MFQAVYESPWHIPITAWIGCAVAVALAITRRRLVAFTVFFAVVCSLDAWLTGPLTPLAQDSAAMTAAGVTFVIAGDFRWFALLERAARKRWSIGGFALALVLAFIVPIAVQIARAAGLSEMRKIFLVYELCFFVLATIVWFFVLPKRFPSPSPWATFARRLTLFEIAQYGMWAAVDILLLTTKADVGFLFRIVPNVAYYALFLIVVGLWVPEPE